MAFHDSLGFIRAATQGRSVFDVFDIDTTGSIVTIDCPMDTIRSEEDLCFFFEGEDDETSSEELLFSYFRGGLNTESSMFDIIDRVCYEYLERGGPHTLQVRVKDAVGNVGHADECVFYYFTECDEQQKGDVNFDCSVNILDALRTANSILNNPPDPPSYELWGADCNGSANNCDGDGNINVLDVIKIVNVILGLDACPLFLSH